MSKMYPIQNLKVGDYAILVNSENDEGFRLVEVNFLQKYYQRKM